jgi:uncharacterized protein YPO0396
MNLQVSMMSENEQYRICKLQVYNWGTFGGLHEIPISEKGFLFVGGSGTGKTTLLDAFSALLIPPRLIEFNAAASEADRSKRDRNLVSYIRGAWAEQKDEDSGIIAKRYLRPGATWSALALTYKNGLGHIVVLVQIFWLKGNASGSADVKRHFFVFEKEFDLRELEEFGKSNHDIRKLKQSLGDIFARDEFGSYKERFCYLLGIQNDMALKLLHKTQSAKNLGDLNTFLREFMLDKPETYSAAERLINEFGELNAAHQAVITARKQIETLAPARDKHLYMEQTLKQRTNLNELQAGINNYKEIRRRQLLKEQIAALNIEVEGLEGEISRRQGLLENQRNILSELERRHRDIGGDQIEQWEKEKQELERQRIEHSRKQEQAVEACRELGWSLGETQQEFASVVGKARDEIDGLEDRKNAAREELIFYSGKKKDAEDAFTKTIKEVRSLESQLSNIPASMLDMRQHIASSIGISEAALPFVGELIEVKASESVWQGAIERVLRGFALSILVDERYYSALSNYINNTHLGQRLVYYRTGSVKSTYEKSISPDSMIFKLDFKGGQYKDWLQAEIRQRFDYPCVNTINDFRKLDRAITKEGQVKHSKTRHEKDDRRTVDDRRSWVLGFDNREKLSLFKKQAQELAQEIDKINEKIKLNTEQDNTSAKRAMNCQTLVNLQWQEIDPVPFAEKISGIEKLIKEKREGNKKLQEIAEQIKKQKEVVDQEERELIELKSENTKNINLLKDAKEELEKCENDLSVIPPTPYQKENLDERYAHYKEQVRLDNLEKITISVMQILHKETEEVNREIANCEKKIESIFTEFKRTWPMDAGDVDTTLSSAPDFFAKLNRLEIDGLPHHEHRFFDLLKNQSYQNLASLSTYLNNERKTILDRMSLVNESLKQVPFNQSANQKTYLYIAVNDRQLQEVIEFKQDIKQALSFAWNDDDRELAENKFIELRKLVEKLSSQDSEHKRWQDSVLDVRQHVEFIGLEIDESGFEVEIYRSGAGKSGGQRQKLTTTCLAAALRYQLGGNDHGFPMYAPVILDEAFDKADNEFTALAMNIFNNFGFQMIVATPLKSVMTLEPFIGGACFVDIKDRNKSCVFHIEYDDTQKRLNLPAAHKEP